MKSFYWIIISILLNATVAHAEELIFALDVIRHGDRTSVHEFPALNHAWKEGKGNLTEKGAEQTYQLGKKLHQDYVITNHLLNSHYTPEQISIRSTNFERTTESARNVLRGLYPAEYLIIPIETPIKDDILVPNISSICQKTLFSQFATYAWYKKNNQLKTNYERWSKIFGKPITKLIDLIKLGDTVFIYQQHNIPLPGELSSKEIEIIIHEGKKVLAEQFYLHEIGSFLGQRSLQFIIDKLQEVSQQKTPLRYMLLSGHDSTLTILLSALEAPLSESPSYASRLNFSLFKRMNQFIIKIYWNDKLLYIPMCQSHECNFEQLSALMKEVHNKASHVRKLEGCQ